MWQRRCDLKGLVLRAGFVPNIMDVYAHRIEESSDKLGGLFGDIISELSYWMNFSITLDDSFETYGKMEGGLVQGLVDGLIDVAVDGVSITQERARFVDFANPVVNEVAGWVFASYSLSRTWAS